MTSESEHIVRAFESNVQQVYDLMNFDDIVLRHAISQVKLLKERLDQGKFNNPRFKVDNVITSLERVKENESLESGYRTIFNQCAVLLVSYFASAVRDLFARGLTGLLGRQKHAKVRNEEIKITLGELQDLDFVLGDVIGDVVAARRDISFQDMRSIHRAFDTFFGYSSPKDRHTDNVILAQACRHAIVHNGARVEQKVAKQLESATKRDVKAKLSLGNTIAFQPGEIEAIGKSMTKYLRRLADGIAK